MRADAQSGSFFPQGIISKAAAESQPEPGPAHGGIALFKEAVRADGYLKEAPASVESLEAKVAAASADSSVPPAPSFSSASDVRDSVAKGGAAFKPGNLTSALSTGSGLSGGIGGFFQDAFKGFNPRKAPAAGEEELKKGEAVKPRGVQGRKLASGLRRKALQQLLAANLHGRQAQTGYGAEANRYQTSQVFDYPTSIDAAPITGPGGSGVKNGLGVEQAQSAVSSDPGGVRPPPPSANSQETSPPWAKLVKLNTLLILAGFLAVALANMLAKWGAVGLAKVVAVVAIGIAGVVIVNSLKLAMTYKQILAGVMHGFMGGLIAFMAIKALMAKAPEDGGKSKAIDYNGMKLEPYGVEQFRDPEKLPKAQGSMPSTEGRSHGDSRPPERAESPGFNLGTGLDPAVVGSPVGPPAIEPVNHH